MALFSGWTEILQNQSFPKWLNCYLKRQNLAMYKTRLYFVLICAFGLITCNQPSKNAKSQFVRNVVDTVGFAQYDWQMDSIIHRLNARVRIDKRSEWKAVIAPHDDYKYAGEVTYQALSGIHAKTIILFGVAHKARNFNLEDRIVFGSYTHWNAPYVKIRISALQDEILKKLPENQWMVHDSMQMVEHSLEALVPFLQYLDRKVEIIPILVPFMNFARMDEISEALSKVLAEIVHEKGLSFGKDLAIVISNDGVHYGDQDWGGKNMAPFGTDSLGIEKARQLDREIIENCLKGDITVQKVKRFVQYTVQDSDYRQYKWTWCGRYAVPLGLLTANRLNERLFNQPLIGQFLNYATSIDHVPYPVEDIGMGTTAPANQHHWVSYVGMGYR
jgi:MEMO1 family protein